MHTDAPVTGKYLNIRFHNLRHLNATIIFLARTPIKITSSRLVHSTINITTGLYSHVLIDMNIADAEKLNDVIYK
ncbi:site-specific integrase [Clostridium brassicae]|uniref:Integrase n=1 Tax=Clostridium brassicae TaxID=2999072 RepID=A0ABT4D662_9CLOT|nr:integrase [Clostridium brassicae]MCY6957772.1 integrase [Clostridium brassicae]